VAGNVRPAQAADRLHAEVDAPAEGGDVTTSAFTSGSFQPLIGEAPEFDAAQVRKVVLCSARSTGI